MKLFIVTALKEYSDTVASLFKKSGIHVFSVTDIIGFKEGASRNFLDNWFSSGDARFDSVLFFSFTDEENAVNAMKQIKEYNQKDDLNFPLRAFILTVDQFSQ